MAVKDSEYSRLLKTSSDEVSKNANQTNFDRRVFARDLEVEIIPVTRSRHIEAVMPISAKRVKPNTAGAKDRLPRKRRRDNLGVYSAARDGAVAKPRVGEKW